jgi:hypothetical protein
MKLIEQQLTLNMAQKLRIPIEPVVGRLPLMMRIQQALTVVWFSVRFLDATLTRYH